MTLFIRLDLSISASSTDLVTQRQAAADVLQALVSSGHEAESTEIVGAPALKSMVRTKRKLGSERRGSTTQVEKFSGYMR